MIATVSPLADHAVESLSTLTFASRVVRETPPFLARPLLFCKRVMPLPVVLPQAHTELGQARKQGLAGLAGKPPADRRRVPSGRKQWADRASAPPVLAGGGGGGGGGAGAGGACPHCGGRRAVGAGAGRPAGQKFAAAERRSRSVPPNRRRPKPEPAPAPAAPAPAPAPSLSSPAWAAVEPAVAVAADVTLSPRAVEAESLGRTFRPGGLRPLTLRSSIDTTDPLTSDSDSSDSSAEEVWPVGGRNGGQGNWQGLPTPSRRLALDLDRPAEPEELGSASSSGSTRCLGRSLSFGAAPGSPPAGSSSGGRSLRRSQTSIPPPKKPPAGGIRSSTTGRNAPPSPRRSMESVLQAQRRAMPKRTRLVGGAGTARTKQGGKRWQ